MAGKVSYNDLHDHLSEWTDLIAAEYNRIHKRVLEDPGTAGDEGEETWKQLLESWLPANYLVRTKGRIMMPDGSTSPQMDILVLHPSYPKALLDKKTYLSAGVVAAFECKLTLRPEHIRRIVQNSATLSQGLPPEAPTPYHELNRPFVYGLLAHSHIWQGRNSTPLSNIESRFHKSIDEIAKTPRELPDCICISDLATWGLMKTAFIGPQYVPNWQQFAPIYGANGSSITNYIRYGSDFNLKDIPPTGPVLFVGPRPPFGPGSEKTHPDLPQALPLGSLLSSLWRRFARNDPSIRPLAAYFDATQVSGVGQGAGKLWGGAFYSPPVRNGILLGKLTNTPYDDWCMTIH